MMLQEFLPFYLFVWAVVVDQAISVALIHSATLKPSISGIWMSVNTI